jgi:hypothetical protein
MTVYVDDMQAPFRNMVMCHMIADTDVELHAMADRIGVARRWYQGNHYDIAQSKRRLAVAAGAVEIAWRQCGLMTAVVKMGFPMPQPDCAEMAFWAARQLTYFRDLNRAYSIAEFPEIC